MAPSAGYSKSNDKEVTTSVSTSRSNEEEPILYDADVVAEWSPDDETALLAHTSGTSMAELPKRMLNTVRQKITRPLDGLTGMTANLQEQWAQRRGDWPIALSPDGRTLAVWRDNTLELRYTDDGFGIARATVPTSEDESPLWRQLAWSFDGQLLALAGSDNIVRVLDVFGQVVWQLGPARITRSGRVMSIDNIEDTPSDLSSLLASDLVTVAEPIAAVIFRSPRHLTDDHSKMSTTHELLVIASDVSQTNSVNASNQPSASLPPSSSSSSSKKKRPPLSSIGTDTVVTGGEREDHVVTKLKDIWTRWRLPNHESVPMLIHLMAVSPKGDVMATLTIGGDISIWQWKERNTPVLRMQWTQQQLQNLLVASQRTNDDDIDTSQPLDHVISLSWWDDNRLLVGFSSGIIAATSLHDNDCTNCLGSRPFQLRSSTPLVCHPAFGALVLEKDVTTLRVRVQGDRIYLSPSTDEDDEDAGQLTQSASSSINGYDMLVKLSKAVTHSLAYLTDTFLWQFESDAWKAARGRYVTFERRSFRLIVILEISPAELMQRQIALMEYEEALSLARKHNLSADPIYQARWLDADIDEQSIHDYLSRIENRLWVLDSCLTRVPVTPDAMRLLIDYGCNALIYRIATFPIPTVDYPASSDTVTRWYKERARHIDDVSGRLDYAILLLEQGHARGVEHLTALIEDAKFLSQLCYEQHPSSPIWTGQTLRLFEQSPITAIVSLMLSRVTPDQTTNSLRQLVLPYLYHRQENPRSAELKMLLSIIYAQSTATELQRESPAEVTLLEGVDLICQSLSDTTQTDQASNLSQLPCESPETIFTWLTENDNGSSSNNNDDDDTTRYLALQMWLVRHRQVYQLLKRYQVNRSFYDLWKLVDNAAEQQSLLECLLSPIYLLGERELCQ
ncbi:hypothetical protein BDF22DRAFT_654937 [Syncephalis plumigaleata]|nr:hypothetical protein BDF22DRAFT_654937 [Syncephalis plumigaleata]